MVANARLSKGKTYISQTWGLSETTKAVTAMPRDESDVTGSISPILPNMEMRIVDENWNVCALSYHSIVCYAVFLFQLTTFRMSNLASLAKFLFVDRLLPKAIMTIERTIPRRLVLHWRHRYWSRWKILYCGP